MIAGGYFSPGAPDLFRPVFDALLRGGDHFLLLADYASYIACQERIDELYKNPEEWTRRAILNMAGMGKFSSDRAIREYAEKIWNVKAVEH
jgi:starch phosphorylase